MEPNIEKDFPADRSAVIFTDMQGIERKGMYKKDFNGFVENTELELPIDSAYVFPEEDITSWTYQSESEN